MSAREEILTRLRMALRDVPAAEGVADVPVARSYQRTGTRTAAESLDLFAERVADYRATVYRCAPTQLATVVTGILAAHDTNDLLVPDDLPASWYHGYSGAVHRDSAAASLPLSTLDTADTVLTGCAVAIAATGTLILDSGEHQGRRALTLVPDHHICVVLSDAIAEILPEALARLTPTRPLTFISGPSATSDIEFDRVEGVHGPRNLDVILVS